MFCRTLSCFFGSAFDPGNDEWLAIKVYLDGNPIELARFPTEDEAEDFAMTERDRELEDNGQFGVGA